MNKQIKFTLGQITALGLVAATGLLAGGCEPAHSASSAPGVAKPQAAEVAIIFPPGLPKPQFQTMRTNLETYIKKAPAGSHFMFIEAGTPRLVAELTIPHLKYDSPKSRDLKVGVPLDECLA